MATKKTTTTKSSSSSINWSKVTGICAFFAIVIAGLIFIISGILRLLNISFGPGILSTISTILLVLAVVIPGWRFVRGKKMWIQILFWVCAICLIVFGAISFNM